MSRQRARGQALPSKLSTVDPTTLLQVGFADYLFRTGFYSNSPWPLSLNKFRKGAKNKHTWEATTRISLQLGHLLTFFLVCHTPIKPETTLQHQPSGGSEDRAKSSKEERKHTNSWWQVVYLLSFTYLIKCWPVLHVQCKRKWTEHLCRYQQERTSPLTPNKRESISISTNKRKHLYFHIHIHIHTYMHPYLLWSTWATWKPTYKSVSKARSVWQHFLWPDSSNRLQLDSFFEDKAEPTSSWKESSHFSKG